MDRPFGSFELIQSAQDIFYYIIDMADDISYISNLLLTLSSWSPCFPSVSWFPCPRFILLWTIQVGAIFFQLFHSSNIVTRMPFIVPFCYGLVSTKASAWMEINRIGLIHENDELSVGKVFFLRWVSLL